MRFEFPSETREKERRSKIRILVDILKLIRRKGGMIKPTHILYGANLSHKRLIKYLEWLREQDFIQKVKKGESYYYRITEKGENFVNEFKKIEDFSDAFGISI